MIVPANAAVSAFLIAEVRSVKADYQFSSR
jgi:hypothetical protein